MAGRFKLAGFVAKRRTLLSVCDRHGADPWAEGRPFDYSAFGGFPDAIEEAAAQQD
jgi:hypothetical protein